MPIEELVSSHLIAPDRVENEELSFRVVGTHGRKTSLDESCRNLFHVSGVRPFSAL
jgi:hypothetical protein